MNALSTLRLGVSLLIFHERFRELIGTGRAVSALYAAETGYNVVYIHAERELRYALRIAATAADEFERRNFVILHVEDYFARACSRCLIRFHSV